MKNLLRYLISALVLLLPFRVQAQVWPTQVNTIIIPPYSPYTSDYVNTPGKMIVNLLLRDVSASNVKVKMRISIEGQGTGVRLTTNPNAVIPPLTLDGGVSLRLTDADLAPYFRAENLVFNGMSAGEYTGTGGKLPEDLYRICFEVYEYNTGAKLSVSNGCANAWILLNDPPLLNLPGNAVKVSVTNPSIVTFSWTPRHKGSPNAAFSTEYLFQLVELMPGFDANPTAAFLSSVPIYETTTSNTQLVYGMMGEVPLEAGRSYAWRVKAKSIVAAQEMDLFKNQGFSEIWYFTYSGDCAAPKNITAKANGTSRIEISWTATGTNQAEYVVSYRKSGVANAVWFDEKTTATSLTVSDLSAGTTYDYKVRASCGGEGESMDSKVDTVSTLTEIPSEYTCGMISPDDTISNMQPLAALSARDEIKAGFFKVKLTKVSGANGSFSGEGYISIPLLKKAKIAVTFTNILVNTDYKLAKGVIITAYDPTWSGVNDLDAYFEGGGGTGKVVYGKPEADVVVDVTVANIQVTPNASGGATLTITDTDGKEYTQEVDHLPSTVKDKDGNIYKANADGTVTQIATSGNTKLPPSSELNTLHSDVATVTFMAHPKQAYAFDAFRSDYLKSLLFGAKYEKLSDNYYVSAKAIGAGKTDLIKAQVSINNADINADSIRFVTGTGTRFVASKIDNYNWEITILGGPADDAQELYAVVTTKDGKTITLGKLLIAGYENQERKVVLVPVNGGAVDKDAIAQKLQRVYGPLAAKWNVVMDEPFTDGRWDLDGDHVLDVGSGGLLASRTREMKQLSTIYSAARKIDEKAVYLFIMSDGKDKDKYLSGDMPRSQQFGYLFTNGTADMGWTVAHEIAHGAYHLRHSFDDYGFNNKELPENLMNYSNGWQLTKFQWDAMHDPGVVWGIFESDSDGEAGTTKVEGITLTENTVFATPDGYLIQLPKGAVVKPTCNYLENVTQGPLFSFKDQGQVWDYKTLPTSGDRYFFGYTNAKGEFYKAVTPVAGIPAEICSVEQTPDDKSKQITLSLSKAKLVRTPMIWPSGKAYQSEGNKFYNVLTGATTTASVAIVTVDGCGKTDWSSTVSDLKKLRSKLNSQWTIIIDDGTGNVQKITPDGKSKGTLTYKIVNGEWKATVKLDETALVFSEKGKKYRQEGDLEKVQQIIQDAINAKLEKFKVKKDGTSSVTDVTTVAPIKTEDGGEFNFGNGLSWAEWGPVLMDAGVAIYENAALPECYWNQSNEKYNGYPIHAPGTISGVADGMIDQVTQTAQLVKFGLEIVTDKEKAAALWSSVKKINFSSVKHLVVEGVKDKWNKYVNDSIWVASHELGKDMVNVAATFNGGGFLKGKQMSDGVAATGDGIGDAAEKAAKDALEKGEKEALEKGEKEAAEQVEKEAADEVKKESTEKVEKEAAEKTEKEAAEKEAGKKIRRIFTADELKAIRKSDIQQFVIDHYDDLMDPKNRETIWTFFEKSGAGVERGGWFEELLHNTPGKYKGYTKLDDIVKTAPDIDFDGVLENVAEVVSLKSFNAENNLKKLAGLKGKVKRFANKLQNAQLKPGNENKRRVLDFVINVQVKWTEAELNQIKAEVAEFAPSIVVRFTEL